MTAATHQLADLVGINDLRQVPGYAHNAVEVEPMSSTSDWSAAQEWPFAYTLPDNARAGAPTPGGRVARIGIGARPVSNLVLGSMVVRNTSSTPSLVQVRITLDGIVQPGVFAQTVPAGATSTLGGTFRMAQVKRTQGTGAHMLRMEVRSDGPPVSVADRSLGLIAMATDD